MSSSAIRAYERSLRTTADDKNLQSARYRSTIVLVLAPFLLNHSISFPQCSLGMTLLFYISSKLHDDTKIARVFAEESGVIFCRFRTFLPYIFHLPCQKGVIK